jgi:hypothetical protein
MLKRGIKPDVQAINSLINAFAKVGFRNLTCHTSTIVRIGLAAIIHRKPYSVKLQCALIFEVRLKTAKEDLMECFM